MQMEFYKINYNITITDMTKFNYPNKKIGVIVHIEDKDEKILLQQRGIQSRDENGLYENVGGSLENDDKDFKSAIIREMKEEMGCDANVEISDAIGIYHVCKKDINWIFIIFYGKYIDGQIKIMEPDKCMEYKFFAYEELLNSDLVTESCKYLIKSIRNSNN